MNPTLSRGKQYPGRFAGRVAAISLLTCCLFLATASLAERGDPFSAKLKFSAATVQASGQVGVEAAIAITTGHYLYKSETRIEMVRHADFRFTAEPLPPAITKADPFLKKPVEIYENSVVLRGNVSVPSAVKAGDYNLEFQVHYQGCSADTCFLPQVETLKAQIKVIAPAEQTAVAVQAPLRAEPNKPETTSFAATLSEKGLLYTLALCFVSGILLSLTPCVYPLIPITVGVIGAGSLGRPLKGFFLSISYVLGISLTYSLLGIAAATTGSLFGSLVQSPWVSGVVALVFFALSLSMFGLFDMPMFTALAEKYQGRTGTGMVGVFLAGLVAGLVATPCVGPVLAGLLLYVSTTGNALLGFLMLFIMGWGMGLLLIALGTFSGAISLLPRSGEWMALVKQVFGMFMLGAALYYFERVVPWPVFLGVLGVALLLLGVFSGALDPLTPESGAIVRLRKTFGLLCAIVAVCSLSAVALPLVGINPGAGAVKSPDTAERIAWLSSEADGLAQARREGKPALMDFWASWCAVCIHLDESTFSHPDVVKESRRFVCIKVDCTDTSSPSTRELFRKYNVVGLPTIVFLDSQGDWLRQKTISKYVGPAEFLDIIRAIR